MRIARPVRRAALASSFLILASLSACATSTSSGGKAEAGKDTLDLGLFGPEARPALVAVAKAPYAVPTEPDCAWLRGEIAALDGMLGPDVDEPVPPTGHGAHVERLATDAVVGAIPYRGVVRWLSGARAKERAEARAILAASARRGFLKGVGWSKACAAKG